MAFDDDGGSDEKRAQDHFAVTQYLAEFLVVIVVIFIVGRAILVFNDCQSTIDSDSCLSQRTYTGRLGGTLRW